ncbi:Outer membrane protein OmpU [Moritella sp. JT01]|uniref:porin n=1 Tax=Moritella sp. JT01 TaxID=756698 RepID=UPI0007961FCD|nr:porin [Moritella sp. JT01]KXO12617.1 Outer membrane protein OmpU [Moritella sp. JT01]
MNNINKALSFTLATLVSTSAIADTIDTDDFSFGGRVEGWGGLVDSSYEDNLRVRLNGQGKHQINDAITAIGKLEFEFSGPHTSSNGIRNYTRYAYVGAETAYGTLTYGTQDNAVTYLTDFTDMAEIYSGYTNDNIEASDDRAEETILYSLSKGDFKFNASANLKGDENGGGVMVAYQLRQDVEVSAGYAATEATGRNSNSSDVYMLGARYTKDSFLLSGLVQKGTIYDADFDAVDAFASYDFGENKVSVSYNYLSADNAPNLHVNFVAFEYGRYIGDVALYTGYKVALSSDTSAGGGQNANEFMLGARYSF